MSKASANPKQPALTLLPVGPVLLIAISAALSLLAVWQWMELRVLAAGGETVCGISEGLNCGQVWTGTFANRIHSALGMPIAALGLVYGLTALGLSATLVHRALSAKPLTQLIAAIRLTAVMGVLTCITMLVASLRTGSACLMCIATYLLVAAFAVVSAKLLPGALQPADADLKPAVLWAGAFAVGAYLLLLYPGLKTTKPGEGPALPKLQAQTPKPDSHEGHAHGPGEHHGDSPLAQFLSGLQPMEVKALTDALNTYRASTVPQGASQFVGRFRKGPENAPVKIVDFVDIKCGHCRMLEETLGAISAAVPEGSYSVEPHYFPLDSECNKSASHTDGSGTRCAAARASICLEGNEYYWKAREEMFNEQETLTKERVLEIASKGPLSRAQLEACMSSTETQAKIDSDVAYALRYNIQGTPLVLINGREGHPMGSFLYVMIMTGGNLSAPELKPLLGG